MSKKEQVNLILPEIERLAEQVGQYCLAKKYHLITAESCTGGMLSAAITAIPGSSGWFEGGFISYANIAKEKMLGVNPKLIKEYGAVSEEVAIAMAEGALKHSHADLSIAITGIAGPGGATAHKPLGLVWIAYANEAGFKVEKHTFSGSRESIRLQACYIALKNLLSWATVVEL